MSEPEPRQWTRETGWRQGHVLPSAAVRHFGLSNAVDPAGTCVVVVSHDCDLANADLAVEPEVEVIAGRIVASADGNFTWGKAPRTLHYTAQRGGSPVVVELVTPGKRSVAKADLARFDPDRTFVLDANSLAVLRSWLGSRYNRTAFPDAFVNRMRATKAEASWPGCIVLVFSPGDDADAAADKADDVAAAVEKAVRDRLKERKDLVLKSCFAISEEDITISRARLLSQWRLEYMTLRTDDEDPGPPDL